MPTSHFYQINEIIELILLTKPEKILDIGIGYGKYGFLSREYLEIWGEENKYNSKQTLVDGLEAFEEYITETHRKIYNNIYIGNALEVLPTLKTKYDLILLIDVIEHFDQEEGTRLLKFCFEAGKNIIISTPRDIYVQGDVFNNPYEEHKFQWEKKHFRELREFLFISNTHSVIGYAGTDLENIKTALAKRKREDMIIRFKLPIKKALIKTNLLDISKNLLGRKNS